MTKILRGLRGATTARANTSEAILQATAELLRALLEANDFQPEDVESAIFTSSPDLTAEYPARAARLLGWRDVPLLGAAEVPVPDGLPRCIRVLLHFHTTRSEEHTSELQSRLHLVCRLLLEKKKKLHYTPAILPPQRRHDIPPDV